MIFRHVFATEISTGGLINVELSENKSIKNELCRNDLHLTNFLSNFQKCSKSENNISVPWTKKSVGSKYAVEVAGVSTCRKSITDLIFSNKKKGRNIDFSDSLG